MKNVDYRKLAFAHYDPLCAHCGFGIPAVLEVAHIDGDRQNNALANLVILCPNCHKMLDLDLISNETILHMRDRPKVVTWSKRMKQAGQKSALTRLRRAAGRKAAATRKRRGEEESPTPAGFGPPVGGVDGEERAAGSCLEEQGESGIALEVGE